MSARSLIIEPAGVEPSRIEAYGRLLSEVFGEARKFTPPAIAWRYRDNPDGLVVGADAWDGDRLAAHYVTCPTMALIDGRPTLGLLSLNSATHPDYQGQGLFTRLMAAAYGQGEGLGYAFVIGVANANSTPGMVRKAGFQNAGPLAAGFLARAPRRMSAAPLQYQGDWDEARLRWRMANPANRYVAARCGDLTGVWADTPLPGVRSAAFMAARFDGLSLAPRKPLSASLFLGLEPRLSLRRQGLIEIPRRLRPSPLNLVWRRLGGSAPEQLDRGATAFNFLDFDPY